MFKAIIITLTAITTFTFSAVAQTPKPEPLQGYIVSNKGDTLFGEINYLKKTGYRQSMIVKFPDQTTKTCSSRSYKFVKAGDQIFESYPVQNGDVIEQQFFWKKTSGKLDFFEYQYEMYVANNNVTKSEFYIKKKGSEDLIRLNGANFKKKVAEMVQDNPKTVERIEAKETKLEDLEEILAEYNKGA